MLILVPLVGLAAGAAGMYLLDPQQGRSRRARLRDQFASRSRGMTQVAGAAVRDLRNRARGTAAQVQRWSSMQEGEVPDRVLVERVRSRLGRFVSHARAVKVDARYGRVTLRGAILSSEHDDMLRAVRRVRGVQDVEDLVQRYDSAQGVSSLQGEGSLRRPGRSEVWTPTARALSGGTGAALLMMGVRKRGVLGTMASLAGALMMTRAMSNQPLSHMAQQMGTGAGNLTRRAGEARRGTPRHAGDASARGRMASVQGGTQRRADVGAPEGWQSPATPRSPDVSPAEGGGDEAAQSYPKPAM